MSLPITGCGGSGGSGVIPDGLTPQSTTIPTTIPVPTSTGTIGKGSQEGYICIPINRKGLQASSIEKTEMKKFPSIPSGWTGVKGAVVRLEGISQTQVTDPNDYYQFTDLPISVSQQGDVIMNVTADSYVFQPVTVTIININQGTTPETYKLRISPNQLQPHKINPNFAPFLSRKK